MILKEILLCYLICIGKHAYSHHFFLRAIINIFLQVKFPNMITYLDRTFKKEQNDVNSVNLVGYLFGFGFGFLYIYPKPNPNTQKLPYPYLKKNKMYPSKRLGLGIYQKPNQTKPKYPKITILIPKTIPKYPKISIPIPPKKNKYPKKKSNTQKKSQYEQ